MPASQLFSGSGNPNGVVIGDPGDIYQDQTGGLWVNETAPSTWTQLGPTATFAHQLTVANGGTPDHTSIKAAVNAAILAGASANNPYNILVSAGTYNEDPFTVPTGVFISSEAVFPNAVIVNANNAAIDLIGLAGGVLVGLTLQGVTGPGAALVRCTSTPTLWNCRFRHCTIGVAAIGAGVLIGMINCGIVLTGLNQTVTTGVLIQGGAQGALTNFVALVPAPLAALYAPNDPVSTTISVQGGTLNMASSLLAVAGNTGTQTLLLADAGGSCELSAVTLQLAKRALAIGSVGVATRIDCIGGAMRGNTVNVTIQSSTGLMLFGGMALDTDTRNIVPGGKLTGTILSTADGSNKAVGDQFLEFTPGDEQLDVSDYYHYLSSTGIHNGGVVTETGGLGVSVTLGTGIIENPINQSLHNVSWTATPLVLANNTTSFVFYDNATNTVIAGAAPPGTSGILFATVVTLSGSVLFNHNTSWTGETAWLSWVDYLLAVRKIRVANGLITTQGSTVRNLDISNGLWYRAMTPLTYPGGNDVTWTYFYGPNGVSNVPGQTLLDITNYDNGGVLTAMTAGFFRQDVVVITSDDRISVLYGTTQWPTSTAAQAASATPEPSFMSETGAPLAHVIVQQGLGIDTIIDVRPLDGASGSGAVTGVTSHSALSNLLADDHPQYLRTDGSRVMTGDLQGGANNAVNFTTYNGVTVEAHEIRHAPGGIDALSLGSPVAVAVGVPPSDGVAASYVRSDHQHGIPAGVNPSALAIGDTSQEGVSGSVARADHVHAFPAPASPVDVTKTAAAAGVATTAARADHKHDVLTAVPVAIVVGAAPAEGTSTALGRADHQHGIPAGVNPSALAIGDTSQEGVSGSVARADHVHAFPAPASPVDVTKTAAAAGVATTAARADHKHDVLTAVPVAIVVGAAPAEGTSTALGRADHQHGIPAGVNPSALVIGDTSQEGASGSVARADHVHAFPAPASPVDVTKTAAAAGVATTAARADHKHDVLTAVPVAIVVGAAPAEGTSTALGRADHQHGIPAGVSPSALAIGNTSQEGVSGSVARADHVHAFPAPASPVDVTKTAAAAGVATTAARADHKHDVLTAVPVAIVVGAAPAEGTSTALGRADHQHGIPAGISPSALAIGNTSQEGVSGSVARADHVHAFPAPASPVNVTKAAASAGIATTAARADHKHDVTTAVPVAVIVGAAPSEGVSTSLARADHQHGIAGGAGTFPMAYSITRPGADGTPEGTIAQTAANALPTGQPGHIRVMDVSFPAAWVGGTITVNGTAPNGAVLSEVFTKPAGGGLASGSKAFLSLTSFVNSSPSGPVGVVATVQTSPLMGVPQVPVLAFLKVAVDGAADSFTFTSLANGTFNATSPHTGNHTIELWYTITPPL